MLFNGAWSWKLPLTLIRVQSDLYGATQCFNQKENEEYLKELKKKL